MSEFARGGAAQLANNPNGQTLPVDFIVPGAAGGGAIGALPAAGGGIGTPQRFNKAFIGTGGIDAIGDIVTLGNGSFGGNLVVTGSINVGALVVASLTSAGNITVQAGGITVTGNSTITGTLTGLTGLTVASGGATITLGGLTVSAGGITVTGNSTITGTLGGITTLTLTTSVTTTNGGSRFEHDISGNDSQPVTFVNGGAFSNLSAIALRGQLKNSAAAFKDFGTIRYKSLGTAAGAEAGAIVLTVLVAGAATDFLTADGAANLTTINSPLKVVGAFAANGAAAQTAFASGGAAPAGGVGTAAGGWDTAAHRDAAITLLNNIRTALVNNGIMS